MMSSDSDPVVFMASQKSKHLTHQSHNISNWRHISSIAGCSVWWSVPDVICQGVLRVRWLSTPFDPWEFVTGHIAALERIFCSHYAHAILTHDPSMLKFVPALAIIVISPNGGYCALIKIDEEGTLRHKWPHPLQCRAIPGSVHSMERKLGRKGGARTHPQQYPSH